ncbi:MAG: hypothetical protein Kow0042_07270 [Calditrichia bacterium]
MKILLVSTLAILLSITSSFTGNIPVPVELPSSFPPGRYTPHGYLDNPWHSMIFNRSGVIRSVAPLGFGFWKRKFWGSYAEGPRGHINYLSLLNLSISLDGKQFIDPTDFKENGVELYSAYHTKHLISYDWSDHEVQFSLKYFLPFENSLVCLLEITNGSSRQKKLRIHANHIYGDWEIKWWGSDGLTARYDAASDVMLSKIWAYGDVFILGADWASSGHFATDSEKRFRKWQKTQAVEAGDMHMVKGSGPLYSSLRYERNLPPGKTEITMIYLCRGKNERWARNQLQQTRSQALDVLREQLAEDEKFWSSCPQLTGDWPEFWKHGWVYDWETLRMNIRRPIGIFHYPWDAMQVHSPRVVLGETALDMLMMSYANPDLAKEVINGTFADALAPNVPCVREDGSVNMIGADGSECGTAPMWGFPFHVIHSIYLRNGDEEWVAKLYPYLKSYIEWWLENRTDDQGWLHCNNSWESGQDGSRRFLVKGEGDPAEFVRTVDVEASMAEAMGIMNQFARLVNQAVDTVYWNRQAQQRIRNTRSMFVDGWFRDIDGRNGKPILLKDFYDPIMLAPLTCRVATAEQIEAIRPQIRFIADHKRWLEWPPGVMAFTEAAWFAGERVIAGRVVADIADRIYARTDSREVMFMRKGDPFAYRIPGIANEFWPWEHRPAGGENYGWGATLPSYIIRNIIGFREADGWKDSEFYLAPALPSDWIEPGKSYGITNLHFRDSTFDLRIIVDEDRSMHLSLKYRSPEEHTFGVKDESGKIIAQTDQRQKRGEISFTGPNGALYRIYFE